MNIMKTVTIGIPAHNEEINIPRLLDSIIKQRKSNFTIESLTVACDGCTDNTANIVRGYSEKYPWIKVIDDNQRLGQAGRLNNFFRANNSDIFITFDADIILAHDHVIEELVKAFNSPKIGLVGGLDTAAKPQTFFEKIAVTWTQVWVRTKMDINGGINIHNHHGFISAFSRELCKVAEIKPKILANDDCAFFEAITHGFEFNFARNAEVIYRCPNNLKDYLKQTARLLHGKDMIAAQYGNWVYPYYDVPIKYKVKGLLETFIRKPFLTIFAVILQIYLRLNKNKFLEKFENGFWTATKSSKI